MESYFMNKNRFINQGAVDISRSISVIEKEAEL